MSSIQHYLNKQDLNILQVVPILVWQSANQEVVNQFPGQIEQEVPVTYYINSVI